ncbi:hypothetical protein K7X08_030968 [Anisodus acutangulus]|uniref:Uncharacterized protein n=1 Tax=Anisodus acutangulus TaxID=402998 RepID=A0A9Q1MXV4_9SOLA|nr:hypothetical protein K7X08_030968 [Anisodus acutangulus]
MGFWNLGFESSVLKVSIRVPFVVHGINVRTDCWFNFLAKFSLTVVVPVNIGRKVLNKRSLKLKRLLIDLLRFPRSMLAAAIFTASAFRHNFCFTGFQLLRLNDSALSICCPPDQSHSSVANL